MRNSKKFRHEIEEGTYGEGIVLFDPKYDTALIGLSRSPYAPSRVIYGFERLNRILRQELKQELKAEGEYKTITSDDFEIYLEEKWDGIRRAFSGDSDPLVMEQTCYL